MFEFPPAPFPESRMVLTLLQGIVFATFVVIVRRLCSNSRTPRSFDISLISILYAIALTLIITPRRHNLGYQSGYIPFPLLLFLFALGMIIFQVDALFHIRERVLSFLKKTFVLAQCVVFFWLNCVVVMSAGNTGVRYTFERVQCLNNMRDLGIAVYNYAIEQRGAIPATAGGDPPRSWRVELLPFIEQRGLREAYDEEVAWNEGENAEIARTEIEVYQCPATPIQQTPEGYQLTGYAAVTGTNAMWAKQKSLSLDNVTNGDGLSQTLMIVEACGQNIAWSEPRDVDLDTLPIGINLPGERKGQSNGVLSSYHGYGANVIFGDGSGRNLSEDIDPEILKKLCTATGGEVLKSSDF